MHPFTAKDFLYSLILFFLENSDIIVTITSLLDFSMVVYWTDFFHCANRQKLSSTFISSI